MIIFAGDNTFASYQAALEHARKLASNDELLTINADELANISQLRDQVDSVSLFSQDKVLFVKRLFKSKLLVKQLVDSPALIANDTIICWEDGKLDGKLNLVKQLRSDKRVNEFELPKEYQIPDWVMKQARSYKLTITKPLATSIVERVGTNLWQLDQELQKLGLYIEIHPGPLSRELVTEITSDTHQQSIWKFLDAVGHKRQDQIRSEFKALLNQSTDIHYIIAMLNRELRLITQYKYSLKHGHKLNLNPYVEKNLASKIKHFSWSDLKRNYMDLLQLDTAIKNGEVIDTSAMLLYLVQM
jgi:DNA polymerase-3 subunit delta